MRTRSNARAPKGTPTDTNLFTMWRYLHEGNGKIPLRIDAGSVTHLRRCMDAGLLEVSPDKTYIRATEEGQRVMEAYQSLQPAHLQTKPFPARLNRSRGRRNPLSASELAEISEQVEEEYRLPSDVAEQIVRYFDGEPKDEAAVRQAYHALYVAPMRPFQPMGTDYWFIDGTLQGEHRVLYKDEDRGTYVLVRRLPKDEYGNERGSLIKAFPTPAQAVDFLNKEARKNRGTTPRRRGR